MRPLAKTALDLVLVAPRGDVAALGSAHSLSPRSNRASTRERSTIDKGESLARIATRLQSWGLIRPALFSRLYDRYVGTAGMNSPAAASDRGLWGRLGIHFESTERFSARSSWPPPSRTSTEYLPGGSSLPEDFGSR